jgi:hypothetical protein
MLSMSESCLCCLQGVMLTGLYSRGVLHTECVQAPYIAVIRARDGRAPNWIARQIAKMWNRCLGRATS